MPATTNGRLHPDVFLNQLRAMTERVVQEWTAVMEELGFTVEVEDVGIREAPHYHGADARINLKLRRPL